MRFNKASSIGFAFAFVSLFAANAHADHLKSHHFGALAFSPFQRVPVDAQLLGERVVKVDRAIDTPQLFGPTVQARFSADRTICQFSGMKSYNQKTSMEFALEDLDEAMRRFKRAGLPFDTSHTPAAILVRIANGERVAIKSSELIDPEYLSMEREREAGRGLVAQRLYGTEILPRQALITGYLDGSEITLKLVVDLQNISSCFQ